MGLRLECPNCGLRTYQEFWYGGEVRTRGKDASEEDDYQTTWLRANIAGVQIERWFHYAGCRRWLTIKRDTRDNSVS